MQKAGEGASGLLPPSAPSSLSSRTTNCYCNPPSGQTQRQKQAVPQTQGSEMSPVLQVHGSTPRSHTLYFICARAPETQSQAAGNSKPRGLGEAETQKPVLLDQKWGYRTKSINYPKMRSNLHWQEMDTLGLLTSERNWIRTTGDKHPLDKAAKADWQNLFLKNFRRGSKAKGLFFWQLTAAGC